MKTTDYQFRPQSWPPPKSRQYKDCYLLGFDEDNIPYVLRYEKNNAVEGWVGATLDNDDYTSDTATPCILRGKLVSKVITAWADLPLLKRVMERNAA